MKNLIQSTLITFAIQVTGISMVQINYANAQTSSIQQLFPALSVVKLSPDQQSQLEKLTETNLAKAEALLSPTQLTQFRASLAEGKSVRETVPSLNVGFSQRVKIARTFESLRSQIEQVLTKDQLEQALNYSRSLK